MLLCCETETIKQTPPRGKFPPFDSVPATKMKVFPVKDSLHNQDGDINKRQFQQMEGRLFGFPSHRKPSPPILIPATGGFTPTSRLTALFASAPGDPERCRRAYERRGSPLRWVRTVPSGGHLVKKATRTLENGHGDHPWFPGG